MVWTMLSSMVWILRGTWCAMHGLTRKKITKPAARSYVLSAISGFGGQALVDVSDNDVARAHMPANGHRHDTDGPSPGDEDVLAGNLFSSNTSHVPLRSLSNSPLENPPTNRLWKLVKFLAGRIPLETDQVSL